MIIFFTVTIIDFALIWGVRNYYYKNIQNTLDLRIENSLNLYEKYYSDRNLNDFLYLDTDALWSSKDMQIQIIDTKNEVVYDSLGTSQGLVLQDNEILSKPGQINIIKDQNLFGNDGSIHSTREIRNNKNEIIGYLRFISSLRSAKMSTMRVMISVVGLSVGVLIVSLSFIVVFSRSLTKPLYELTKAAKKFSNGQYQDRIKIKSYQEIDQLTNTMNLMAEEILKKEQIKNDFISSISHELRTPLTSIKGWAVVLKDLKPEEADYLRDGLEIIESESDRLGKMVENLLDFSRFISGRISLEKATFNIAATCKEVIKQLMPKLNNNKIVLIDESYDDVCLTLGDENRIKQVLINVMDNAIKFTEESGWVKVSSFPDDKFFRILISDNGRGISKEEIAHVKEKFYKGKHSKSHSGIGLSVSDEIVKLHGGKLEIFSEKNMGTTVSIMIPIVEERV